MGKIYSKYMKALDARVKDVRGKYKKAYTDYKAAEKAEQEAERLNNIHHSPQSAAAYYDAKAKLATAKAAWGSVEHSLETLRAEADDMTRGLMQEYTAANVANPDEIDNAGLMLLNADFLNAADLVALAQKYKGNATMNKFIRAKAEKMRDAEAGRKPHATEDPAAFRQHGDSMQMILNVMEATAHNGLDDAAQWKDTVSTMNTIIGVDHSRFNQRSPEANIAMLDKWESAVPADE